MKITKSKLISFLIIPLAIFMYVSFSVKDSKSNKGIAKDEISIVCSFSILQDVVSQLCEGASKIKVYTVVPNAVDPHVYNPKPSDTKLIKEADLVFVNGLMLEGWIDNLIKGSGYKGKIIVATNGIKPRYGCNCTNRAFPDKVRSHDCDPDGKIPDPHVWQDPLLMVKVIKTLSNELCSIYPQYKETFKTNEQKIIKEFVAIYEKQKDVFLKIPDNKKSLLTTHDAFSYMGERYDLNVISPIGVNTSFDPSASNIAKIINSVKKNKISAVFLEDLANPKIINKIADECKIKIDGTLYADALKEGCNLQETLLFNTQIIIDTIH